MNIIVRNMTIPVPHKDKIEQELLYDTQSIDEVMFLIVADKVFALADVALFSESVFVSEIAYANL